MRAIIVDDEKRSIDNLRWMLAENCPEIEVVSTCKDIDTAYDSIDLLKPDLVFLDIDMPPDTGFDLLKKYNEIPFEVIFVTAYDQYAIQAIKFSALYYIMKPIKDEELIESVSKAKKKLSIHSKATSYYFQTIQPKFKELNRIVIHTQRGSELIELENIYYLEAEDSYTSFYLKNDKRITCSQKTIGEYEELLQGKDFFRTHKSYLINLSEIQATSSKEGLEVILKNQKAIPIARRRKAEFLSLLR